MKDQFVTYEIAKRLKELGFNEPCIAAYDEENQFEPFYDSAVKDHGFDVASNMMMPPFLITAPLWQQAIDWLREEHNILIHIKMDRDWVGYFGLIERIGEPSKNIVTKDCETYNEAREAAITKALELIK